VIFALLFAMLESVKKKLIHLDNERLAIGVVTFLGVALLIPILILTPELIESFNPSFLFEILAQYGSFIAGGAYLGRFVNIMTACLIEAPPLPDKTHVTTIFNDQVIVGRPIRDCEKTLTPIGMLLGGGLAIACIVLHCAVPYLSVFSYFAYVLFALGGVCTVGGLFNRIGSSCDGTRLEQEKKTILVGSIIGILLAVALIVFLCSTGTLPFVAVAGVTKVFFGLFAANKTLFILMGGLTLVSITTSCFDYLAKSYCFLKYRFKFGAQDESLETRLRTRYHEYQGAFLGGVTACLAIIAISAALFLSGVFIGAAPWVVGATLLLICITCLSVIPSLFSRIGRLIDGVKRGASTTTVLSSDQPTVSERPVPEIEGSLHHQILYAPYLFIEKQKEEDCSHRPVSLKRAASCPSIFYHLREGESKTDTKFDATVYFSDQSDRAVTVQQDKANFSYRSLSLKRTASYPSIFSHLREGESKTDVKVDTTVCSLGER
jgi:hypothetical protein